MARGFGGTVRFVEEDYGNSALAKRFGVTRYPAIFVDDVLVATPDDFGFYGKGEKQGGGRYTPLRDAATHGRFRADLTRMIDLVVAGRVDEARARAATANPAGGVAALPAVSLTALDGRILTRADLEGRVVVVELWATWCPPCRGTLAWLGTLKRRYGDRLAVVAIAIQSEDAAVRKVAADLDLPFVWSIGTPEIIRAFGDVSAVPTLLFFDRQARAAGAFYGAPPTLHAEGERVLAALFD